MPPLPSTFARAPTLAASPQTRTASIPWYVWCLAAATAADLFGGYWDISWHISIGRDTFWTPAHMMIYLAGVLAGVASGYAILSTTFGSSQEAKDASISVWGFRGPLGCFMAAWGGFAMLTSAPFDNWWHNAYGLDVKIVSLPHSMLGIGELMIELGAMLLVCAHLNRASGAYQRKLDWLLLVDRRRRRSRLRDVHPRIDADGIHAQLGVLSRGGNRVSHDAHRDLGRLEEALAGHHDGRNLHRLVSRRPVDIPAVPAAPKLGPVYQNITHMVPLWFPVLVIVPAFALDLLRAWMGEKWGGWKSAIAAGCSFHRGVRRGAVAVRGLPDLAGRAQSDLRLQLFRILRSGRCALQPVPFRARPDSRRIRERNGARARDVDHLLLARDGAGQLDAHRAALTRARSRCCPHRAQSVVRRAAMLAVAMLLSRLPPMRTSAVPTFSTKVTPARITCS